jgi:hypothetical protein
MVESSGLGMPALARAYYEASFRDFVAGSDEVVLGHLSRRSERGLDQSQRNAWIDEFNILRPALATLEGWLLLEYSIPRMGRRADAILLFSKVVIVVEFKIGETHYTAHALDQVLDYALDIKNFQKQSHDKFIVPLLLATDASPCPLRLERHPDGLFSPVCANRDVFAQVLGKVIAQVSGPEIDRAAWLASSYCPTPTIVEAAQALPGPRRCGDLQN